MADWSERVYIFGFTITYIDIFYFEYSEPIYWK